MKKKQTIAVIGPNPIQSNPIHGWIQSMSNSVPTVHSVPLLRSKAVCKVSSHIQLIGGRPRTTRH